MSENFVKKSPVSHSISKNRIKEIMSFINIDNEFYTLLLEYNKTGKVSLIQKKLIEVLKNDYDAIRLFTDNFKDKTFKDFIGKKPEDMYLLIKERANNLDSYKTADFYYDIVMSENIAMGVRQSIIKELYTLGFERRRGYRESESTINNGKILFKNIANKINSDIEHNRIDINKNNMILIEKFSNEYTDENYYAFIQSIYSIFNELIAEDKQDFTKMIKIREILRNYKFQNYLKNSDNEKDKEQFIKTLFYFAKNIKDTTDDYKNERIFDFSHLMSYFKSLKIDLSLFKTEELNEIFKTDIDKINTMSKEEHRIIIHKNSYNEDVYNNLEFFTNQPFFNTLIDMLIEDAYNHFEYYKKFITFYETLSDDEKNEYQKNKKKTNVRLPIFEKIYNAIVDEKTPVLKRDKSLSSSIDANYSSNLSMNINNTQNIWDYIYKIRKNEINDFVETVLKSDINFSKISEISYHYSDYSLTEALEIERKSIYKSSRLLASNVLTESLSSFFIDENKFKKFSLDIQIELAEYYVKRKYIFKYAENDEHRNLFSKNPKDIIEMNENSVRAINFLLKNNRNIAIYLISREIYNVKNISYGENLDVIVHNNTLFSTFLDGYQDMIQIGANSIDMFTIENKKELLELNEIALEMADDPLSFMYKTLDVLKDNKFSVNIFKIYFDTIKNNNDEISKVLDKYAIKYKNEKLIEFIYNQDYNKETTDYVTSKVLEYRRNVETSNMALPENINLIDNKKREEGLKILYKALPQIFKSKGFKENMKEINKD